MKTLKSLSLQYLFTCLLLFMAVRVKADGSGIFDRIIRLPRTEATSLSIFGQNNRRDRISVYL